MFRNNGYKKGLQFLIILLLGYMVVRLMVDPNYIADFEAYCPIGGMQAFSSFLVNNTLACSMTETQIFMGIVLLAGVIIFSKLFCSYICPIGTFTEWLGKLGDKIKMRYTFSGFADRALRSLKYGLLFVTFYFTIKTSELFCKEYDPFYAVFSGFGHDVYLWYAIPALLITILGAIFIRQFWCKYLCPLSAATNVFTYAIPVAGIIIIYLIANALGTEISWVWLLAAISIMGFVLESVRLSGWIFPPFKISRNKLTCTDCKECDLSCPMGLEISTVEKVNHIDCHLCGDCLHACPEKETLQINNKDWKWLPASVTVGLILIGLLLATTIELPTINIRWGDELKFSKAGIYTQDGLKNVKCYGSSMSFATKMKRIPGVLGVETFVKSHSVKIYYDTEELTPDELKHSIFTPTKTILRKPGADIESLSVIEIGIDKLFDSYDSFYLTQQFKQAGSIYGFTTEFGEPVLAKLYYSPNEITPEQIKEWIEKPEVTYTSRGKEYTVGVNFSVAYLKDSVTTISTSEFYQALFNPFNMTFNDYKDYKKEDLAIYQIEMPQAISSALRRRFTSLVSHVSTDSFVVRFRTVYNEKPYAQIFYVKDQVTEESILHTLRQDTLTVHYRGGKTGQIVNPFKFPEEGKNLSAENKLELIY